MTRKTYFILMMAFCLTGCVTTQQYAAQSPSVSQIQGGCFASREKFEDQTACIQSALSRTALNPYAQEYVAYMQSLSTNVRVGKTSEDNARVQLTQKLNQLRQKQNNEFAQQQAIANQQALQTQQILQQNKRPPLEVYEMKPLPHPTTTNCQAYGNQVNCTTY